ncbi:MAG: pyridoxamine 5'-phosphate oxidase [Schleiferiaceae bacterium]|nr:pyridoxamine 5'-phosphate oxidase [Schleiferiaceae bacterium]
MDLHNIRESYKFDSLLESNLESNPFDQFQHWYQSYAELRIKDSNAMAIATVDSQGNPSNRIVLLKAVEDGEFIFFTNYGSAKGQDLLINPIVSALFFWREQERQVRIQGKVVRISKEKSEAYFATRPYLSQIGAAASEQSQPIDDRSTLETKFAKFQHEYPEGSTVPMPENWGGFAIQPLSFEFWQGREGRLHDRIVYMLERSEWTISRLEP